MSLSRATADELRAAFAGIDEWVFDLDNTLYPRHSDLFSQIDWKMTDYVETLTGLPREEARALQKSMYRKHGTTLRGLMTEHGLDPHAFLDHVHDIDHSAIGENAALAEASNRRGDPSAPAASTTRIAAAQTRLAEHLSQQAQVQAMLPYAG